MLIEKLFERKGEQASSMRVLRNLVTPIIAPRTVRKICSRLTLLQA